MAAAIYADRGTISLNGNFVTDVQSIEIRRNFGTKYVPTMTTDRSNSGYTRGNQEVNVTFSIAVQDQYGTPQIEDLDPSKDVALTFQHGTNGDRYTLTNGAVVDVTQSAPGVGQEGRKNYTMLFTKIVNQIASTPLFGLSF